MEVLYRNCCGVDVHKKFLVACLLVMDESGQSYKEARRFSTMTGDLLACIDWLEQAHCTAIAMESTGVYWHAPHNLMEGRFEQVIVVNAEHLKRVPGHKTDQKDAEWIAELLQVGLTAAQLHSSSLTTRTAASDPLAHDPDERPGPGSSIGFKRS